MDALEFHYRELLGLDSNWEVDSVDLSTESKRVTIDLVYVGKSVCCPSCSASCSMKDHAPERCWRHLDKSYYQKLCS